MIVFEDDVDEFLAHYGVPGMKWGRHKAHDIGAAHPKAVKVAKRVAIGTALVGGAAATAYILSKNGNTKVPPLPARVAPHTPAARPPSPFEMQMLAGMAAQKNAMDKIGAQALTEKVWTDSVKIAKMNKDMESTTNLLLGNTDAMMKAFYKNGG